MGRYASEDSRAVLQKHGLTGSMGRRGNPYDNAKAESFMNTQGPRRAPRMEAAAITITGIKPETLRREEGERRQPFVRFDSLYMPQGQILAVWPPIKNSENRFAVFLQIPTNF